MNSWEVLFDVTKQCACINCKKVGQDPSLEEHQSAGQTYQIQLSKQRVAGNDQTNKIGAS